MKKMYVAVLIISFVYNKSHYALLWYQIKMIKNVRCKFYSSEIAITYIYATANGQVEVKIEQFRRRVSSFFCPTFYSYLCLLNEKVTW